MQYPLKFNTALHIRNRSLLSGVLEHFKNKTLTVWVYYQIRKACLREQLYDNILMQANIIRTGNDTILSYKIFLFSHTQLL